MIEMIVTVSLEEDGMKMVVLGKIPSKCVEKLGNGNDGIPVWGTFGRVIVVFPIFRSLRVQYT